MGKTKKFNGKRKGSLKFSNKKKQKSNKQDIVVNKKAIFNRYKDKQKIEEEFAKKKQLEDRFVKQQLAFSESEEEEEAIDVFGELISSFSNKKNNNDNVESDFDEDSHDESSVGSHVSDHSKMFEDKASIDEVDGNQSDEYSNSGDEHEDAAGVLFFNNIC